MKIKKRAIIFISFIFCLALPLLLISNNSFKTFSSQKHINKNFRSDSSLDDSQFSLVNQKKYKLDSNLNLLYKRCVKEIESANKDVIAINKIFVALEINPDSKKTINDFANVEIEIKANSDGLNYQNLDWKFKNKNSDSTYLNINTPSVTSDFIAKKTLVKENIIVNQIEGKHLELGQYIFFQPDLTFFLGTNFNLKANYKLNNKITEIKESKIFVGDLNITNNEIMISNFENEIVQKSNVENKNIFDFKYRLNLYSFENNITWDKIDKIIENNATPINLDFKISAKILFQKEDKSIINDYSIDLEDFGRDHIKGKNTVTLELEKNNVDIDQLIDANTNIVDKQNLKTQIKQKKTKLLFSKVQVSLTNDNLLPTTINQNNRFDVSKFKSNEINSVINLQGQNQDSNLKLIIYSKFGNYSKDFQKSRKINGEATIKNGNITKKITFDFLDLKLFDYKEIILTNFYANYSIVNLQSITFGFKISDQNINLVIDNKSNINNSNINVIAPSSSPNLTLPILLAVLIPVLLCIIFGIIFRIYDKKGSKNIKTNN